MPSLYVILLLSSFRGEELSYHPLGMLSDEAFEAYREAPGTLEERRTLSCGYADQFISMLFYLTCVVPVACFVHKLPRFMAPN